GGHGCGGDVRHMGPTPNPFFAPVPRDPEQVDQKEVLERGTHERADAEDNADACQHHHRPESPAEERQWIRRLEKDGGQGHEVRGVGDLASALPHGTQGSASEMWYCTRSRRMARGSDVNNEMPDARGFAEAAAKNTSDNVTSMSWTGQRYSPLRAGGGAYGWGARRLGASSDQASPARENARIQNASTR